MSRRTSLRSDASSSDRLEALVQQALSLSKVARKHGKGLSGDNYYGNRLAELRADATNTFRDISSQSVGDTSAAAELIEATFSATSSRVQRMAAARELIFSLRTFLRSPSPQAHRESHSGFFPQSILVQADRGYLVTIGSQMNGSYARGWFDACAVMLRRLLEISLIEAFEAKGLGAKITDANGNYFQLSDLVSAALTETSWKLSRNTRKHLPKLRDLGHSSAHGRYFMARREDLERLRDGCRVVIEEFLHLAALL